MPAQQPERAHYLDKLPKRAYSLRVLGMGLGGLPVAVVLHELAAPWPMWAWVVFACVFWPHLAYWRAARSRDPFRAELQNFVADSFFAGTLPPLMHYNVLPSVMLVSVAMADKLSVGVAGLWLRSLPGVILALVGFGLFTGFAFHPASSMAVVLASLPVMVIHTLAVSMSSFRLVRRVRKQNQQLKLLSQIDALTGLANHGYWHAAIKTWLAQHQAGSPASLLLVDVDSFKGINDTYGHTVGDDVLRGIGAIIRRLAGGYAAGEGGLGGRGLARRGRDDLHDLVKQGLSGRVGGDELALVVPVDAAQAWAVAEHLRTQIAALRFEHAPALRCTVSIGIASLPERDATARAWMDSADQAMYGAKQNGRDQVAGPHAPDDTRCDVNDKVDSRQHGQAPKSA